MGETVTMTLTDFLLARIADDEAVARASFHDRQQDGMMPAAVDDGVWEPSPYAYDESRVEGIGITIYDEGGHSVEQARHIARHDPARVLAECEAKRRIVERHSVWVCGNQHEEWTCSPERPHPLLNPVDACEDLRALALPYADHPDYRQEWKP